MPINLFHYTSQTGLLGMIENKEIWATNISYLNDLKEFKHTIELIREIIDNEIKKGIIDSDLSSLFEEVVKTAFPSQTIFVASFSEEGDLLSQWRGYCGDGVGYSVGIDCDILNEIALANNLNLTKCLYKVDEQVNELQTFFKWIIQTTNNHEGIIAYLLQMLVTTAPRFKDKAFSEEKEWRLVGSIFDLSKVHFRPGKSTLVPFVKIPLISNANKRMSISKLFISPSPDTVLAKQAIHILCEKHLVNCSNVEVSKAPFKNW